MIWQDSNLLGHTTRTEGLGTNDIVVVIATPPILFR
jgi:hypothetical protein